LKVEFSLNFAFDQNQKQHPLRRTGVSDPHVQSDECKL
jgi:hypothetical protein